MVGTRLQQANESLMIRFGFLAVLQLRIRFLQVIEPRTFRIAAKGICGRGAHRALPNPRSTSRLVSITVPFASTSTSIGVSAVAVTPDGRYVVSGSYEDNNGYVRLIREDTLIRRFILSTVVNYRALLGRYFLSRLVML
jgi:hypothetical protein